jgi:hypothetical protein
MHDKASTDRIRRALDFCRENECSLTTIAATVQQRRSAAAELAAQLDSASQSCDVHGLHVQLIARHARRHMQRAGLEREPSLSMADLTWIADFRLRVDDILIDAVAHDPDAYASIERAWNLLTWEDAVRAAADYVEPTLAAPISAAANRREDALKIAAIFLCASVVAFLLHRPTGIVLGAVTAAIYTYVAMLPPIRRTTTSALPTPSIRTVPELASLSRDELAELRRRIDAERAALIQRMEATPCGDPPLDPYDVVEIPYP